MVGQIAVHKSDMGLFSGYQGETAEAPRHHWFLIPEYGYKTTSGEVRITVRNGVAEDGSDLMT
jgi:hypothetical protein